MTDGLSITIVVENTTPGHSLASEHGLAVHIQDGTQSVLFDTGQSGSALLTNATILGFDLAQVSTLVFSHGHYDHTGGLSAFLSIAHDFEVFLHPDALTPSFKLSLIHI